MGKINILEWIMCPRASIALKKIKNQEQEACEYCEQKNNRESLESTCDLFSREDKSS